MRLHYILLVAAVTLATSSDLISAGSTPAQTKLSMVTSTDSAPAARQLDGTLTRSVANNKRSLRSVETTDKNDEERAIPKQLTEALAKLDEKVMYRSLLSGNIKPSLVQMPGYSKYYAGTMRKMLKQLEFPSSVYNRGDDEIIRFIDRLQKELLKHSVPA